MTAPLPALVQQNTAASTTPAPATITPTLGTASTAGNLLLLAVTVTATSGTPSITTPASWTLLTSQAFTGQSSALFSRPNNPGGITAVAVTLSGDTTGGAVATIAEFSNTGAQSNDFASSTGNTSLLTNFFPPVTAVQELSVYSVTLFGNTATYSKTDDFSTVAPMTASTGATSNVQEGMFFAINGGGSTPENIGSISGNQGLILLAARFLTQGGTIGRGVGGGVFVSTDNNPAGSLQVPQPIAPGNFFSGTTGSF